MKRGRSSKVMREGAAPLPLAPFHFAYHFDQALVGRYLRRKATGIAHLDATVMDVLRHGETGRITALRLEDGTEYEADFFIDCTGFRRALIADALGARWISYGDRLPVNRAMPFWLAHEPDRQIQPYTLAVAMSSVWMWQIPTQARLGCGYVYSDAFQTPDGAKKEIEAALGRDIEPRNDIRIEAGHLDRSWIGYCVAAGLSQSFFEPLEATSIHGTIVQMLLFSQFHLRSIVNGDQPRQEEYNRSVARQVDDFSAFINLHYVSNRADSPFWRHVRADCIGAEVRARLAAGSKRLPRNDDFKPFPGGLAHIEEQLYYPVLDGLGLLDRRVAQAELARRPRLRAHARKSAARLCREFQRAAEQATGTPRVSRRAPGVICEALTAFPRRQEDRRRDGISPGDRQ